MDFSNITIGYGITGSFCTFAKTKLAMGMLKDMGARLIPIYSYNAYNTDTRFTGAEEFRQEIMTITGEKAITTIVDAEPIGPKNLLDVMVIAPCTGNTAAKLAAGITDTPVLMAAKAHIRNGKPLVIAISTNDGLGANLKNLATLLTTKHIYLVPFGQDNPKAKPNSLVADFTKLPETIELALSHRQIQPLLL